jgi:DNA-binding CsgD family transcriptional regulator
MTLSKEAAVRITRREREVLLAVCAGQTAKRIGIELGIRPHTVEAYIDHIRMKLNASNRCHMVAIAIECGLCAGSVFRLTDG